MNQHADTARLLKAIAYTDVLDSLGVTADLIDSLDDTAWDNARALVYRVSGRRCGRPSGRTKDLVKDLLRGRAEAREPGYDPFRGLPEAVA